MTAYVLAGDIGGTKTIILNPKTSQLGAAQAAFELLDQE
jgi:hypothetical protein